MVCSAGSRAVNARSTVRPPTPLSKTPMGASIGLQDAWNGYFEKGMIQEAVVWFGTAKRMCAWKAPAVASMPHRPEATRGSERPWQDALADCLVPDGSVSVYVTGPGQLAPPKSQLSVADPSALPTGSASTSTLESRPSSKRAEAGCRVW